MSRLQEDLILLAAFAAAPFVFAGLAIVMIWLVYKPQIWFWRWKLWKKTRAAAQADGDE